jgi:peroxiredoxin
LASANERINGAGGEVIAVSVDDDERQAAMYARWPTPNVLYVSDPGGERFLQPLDLYDSEERGGIARPSLLVLDAAGDEVFRYRGRDFADRTHDDAWSSAPLQVSAWAD